MKHIIITGATGYLGHHLVQDFLRDPFNKVTAVTGRPEDKANALPDNSRLNVIPCDALYTTDFGHADALIHTAFARGENFPGLAASIEMTRKVIEVVNEQNIDSFINISSQGIYKGLKAGEKVKEDGIVEPNTTYSLMKWSVENMLKLGSKKPYTNIRMASLSANARFLVSFVNSVKEGNPIMVTAPNQYASIMDVTDASSGIKTIVDIPLQNREDVYNLGPDVQYSILEYAETAVAIGRELGYKGSNITIDDKGSFFAICMDCSRIRSQTCWRPVITKELMFTKLF